MTIPEERQRLLDYHDFDYEVIDRVARVADRQRQSTWAEIRAFLPDTEIFHPVGSKPVEVLDIRPGPDFENTQVYHFTMGTAIDENMRTRIATLALAEPKTRIIAVGNPGPPINGRRGKLSRSQRARVREGDLRPTIDPTMQYLNSQRIEDGVTHIGYSFGANKAVAAAQYAELYDQEVSHGILMEPPSVKQRSLLELAKDFGSTGKALKGYLEAANSPAYKHARRLWAIKNLGFVGYGVGLLRPSNLAIARALSQDGFEGALTEGLEAQPEMLADIIWGSNSELAVNGLMLGVTSRLIERYGANRVRATTLEGQSHAMGDDIFLHAALILQSLKKPNS